MSRFNPEPSMLDAIALTRTAYAQLVSQKFHRPRVFGAWTEAEGTREFRWRDVGMKIVSIDPKCLSIKSHSRLQACGFEILFQERKQKASFVNPQDSDLRVSF